MGIVWLPLFLSLSLCLPGKIKQSLLSRQALKDEKVKATFASLSSYAIHHSTHPSLPLSITSVMLRDKSKIRRRWNGKNKHTKRGRRGRKTCAINDGCCACFQIGREKQKNVVVVIKWRVDKKKKKIHNKVLFRKWKEESVCEGQFWSTGQTGAVELDWKSKINAFAVFG